MKTGGKFPHQPKGGKYMGHIITKEFEELFKNYPTRSQENATDPLVIAKLFDNSGTAIWFLLDYNPQHKISTCYVVGMVQDEPGSVSIEDLEKIQISIFGGARIEQDFFFEQKPLSEILQDYRANGSQ